MFSELFRKKVAKFLVYVMLFCNVSPAFAMQAVRHDYQHQAHPMLHHIVAQMMAGAAKQSVFPPSHTFDVSDFGKVRVDENNAIVLDSATLLDPTKSVSFTTDRNVILDSLICNSISITAPNVTVRGKTFVKSLDISLNENGVFAVDHGCMLTTERAVVDGMIHNYGTVHFSGDSALRSNESLLFNHGTINGDNFTLENIGGFINEGKILGQSIGLQSNFLQNDGAMGGAESILDFMVHKSVINNKEIFGKRAKVVLTSDEKGFFNKGSIDISNTELQISGIFINEGTSELGRLTGFVSKLLNKGRFESKYGSLSVNSGENHHILKLESLTSAGDFLNTFTDHYSAMIVESILGAGKLINQSAFEMLGVGAFGIREFYNQNAEFVTRYGCSSFGNAVRFMSSIDKIVNEGSLVADTMSFDDTEAIITNASSAIIKTTNEMKGKVKNFDNLGGIFSEHSVISLMFDTFVHRGKLLADKGVSFTGRLLRNYADLSLHSSKIDRIFNGESIIDDVDDVFFAGAEKAITATASGIATMPLDQRKEAIADILQKSMTMNMPLNEIMKVQEYLDTLNAVVSPTYLPTYHLEQVHGWNGHYSLWNQFSTHPKTGTKTFIHQHVLCSNYHANIVTASIATANNQAVSKNAELEAEYKMKLDALEALSFPICALAKIISVYNKRSIPKTSANLWMYFGSEIERLENTGHVQFIKGLHSIDTYIGTAESELLVPKLDDITLASTGIQQLQITEAASQDASQTSSATEDPDSVTKVTEKSLEGVGKIQAPKHSYHDIASVMMFNLAGDIDIHTSVIPTAFPAFSGNMSVVAKLNGFTNTQEIDLQKIRLVLDLMGMDFTNTGFLICKELSVENCGIFQNKGEIVSIRDMKIRARQAINTCDPIFSATPPPYCSTRYACIAQDLSPILARCRKSRGQAKLVSQDGAIDIEATEFIKNHYSYMFSRNGYKFTSDGDVINNTGYIHSSGESPSYIQAKTFEVACDTPFSMPVYSMHGGQYYCNFGYESSERAQFFCGGDIYLDGLTRFAVKGSDFISGGIVHCNGEIEKIDCTSVYNNSSSVKAKNSVFLNGIDLNLRGVLVLAGRDAIFTTSRAFSASGIQNAIVPHRVQQTDISISDLLAPYGNVISHGHLGHSLSTIPCIGGMRINPVIFGQIPNLANAIFDPVTYSIPFALSLLQEHLGLDSLNPMELFRTLNQNSNQLPATLDADTMPDESFIYFKQKGSKQLALTDGTTEEKPVLSPVIHISEAQLQAAHDLSIELMRLKNGGIRTIDGDTVITGAGSALLDNFKIHSGKKAIISSERSVRIDNSEVLGETVLIQAKEDPTLDRSTGKVLSTASILKATKDRLVLYGEGGVDTNAGFKITDHFIRNGRESMQTQTAEILPMVCQAPEEVIISGGDSAIRGTLVRTKKITDDTIRLFAGANKATLHYHAHNESKKGCFGGKSSMDHYRSQEIAALTMFEVEEMFSGNGESLIFESVIAEGIKKLHVKKPVFREEVVTLHSQDEVKQTKSGFSICGLGKTSIPNDPMIGAWQNLCRAENSKAQIAEAIKTAANIYGSVDDANKLFNAVSSGIGLDAASIITGTLAKRYLNINFSFGSTTTTTISHQTQQIPNQISAELIKLESPTSVHLQGHHMARDFIVDTESFTTSDMVNTSTVESKTTGSSISFNPVSAVVGSVFPGMTVGVGTALMGAVSGSLSNVSQNQGQVRRNSTTVIADRFMLRAGNAHLTDTQIRARLVDAIIRDDLVIESLTDEFFSETSGGNFRLGLGFLSLVNGIQNMADAARVTAGMEGGIIDAKEIDRRVNEFAGIVGEEDFNLTVGGTLLARSAFYGQKDAGQTVKAPRMSVESTNPKEHIKVGNAIHETVQEEHTRRDDSYTVPIGDAVNVTMSSIQFYDWLCKTNEKDTFKKQISDKAKKEGKSPKEVREESEAAGALVDKIEKQITQEEQVAKGKLEPSVDSTQSTSASKELSLGKSPEAALKQHLDQRMTRDLFQSDKPRTLQQQLHEDYIISKIADLQYSRNQATDARRINTAMQNFVSECGDVANKFLNGLSVVLGCPQTVTAMPVLAAPVIAEITGALLIYAANHPDMYQRFAAQLWSLGGFAYDLYQKGNSAILERSKTGGNSGTAGVDSGSSGGNTAMPEPDDGNKDPKKAEKQKVRVEVKLSEDELQKFGVRRAIQEKPRPAAEGRAFVKEKPFRNPKLARIARRDGEMRLAQQGADPKILKKVDVDHTHELQLGGSDTPSNLQFLDKSVNRSIGSQIQQQISGLPEGTKIDEIIFTIGGKK